MTRRAPRMLLASGRPPPGGRGPRRPGARRAVAALALAALAVLAAGPPPPAKLPAPLPAPFPALAGAVPGVTAAAIDELALEHQVKAAFLFNFARYTRWPEGTFADERAPFVFGVLGDSPLSEALQELLAGKTVHERRVEVRRCPSPDEAAGCQVLFVARDQAARLDALGEALREHPVFSVSDLSRMTGAGGVARFLIEDDKVKFEINVDAAARARLEISSQVLKLARLVRDPDAAPAAASERER